MLVFHQNSGAEALNHNMVIFRGGAFEKQLGLDKVVRVDPSGETVLIRRGRDQSSHPPH